MGIVIHFSIEGGDRRVDEEKQRRTKTPLESAAQVDKSASSNRRTRPA